jgi:hypothetical protein
MFRIIRKFNRSAKRVSHNNTLRWKILIILIRARVDRHIHSLFFFIYQRLPRKHIRIIRVEGARAVFASYSSYEGARCLSIRARIAACEAKPG